MLLLQAVNITMSYGQLVLIKNPFSIDVFEGDRIGIVGINGAGKTTLLQILSGELVPDRGFVNLLCDVHFFRQIEESLPYTEYELSKFHGEFCPFDVENPEILSSGQETRLKLANIFAKQGALYFFDEPSSNLDILGKNLLSKKMRTLSTYFLISHDRYFLDICCNKILEIENGKITLYSGNYSQYFIEKEKMLEKSKIEYVAYTEEKKRLTSIYNEKIKHAEKMSKKPKDKGKQSVGRRMGGRSKDAQQKAIQNAAKAVINRMDRMEVKENPHENEVLSINFSRNDPPENKIVLRIEGLTYGFGKKVLFDDACFYVKNKQRLAVLGDNGVGKSTLFRLIVQGHTAIFAVPKVRFGYFNQTLSDIDLNKTVYQNAMEMNIQEMSHVRAILRKMLFPAGDLDKLASVLSGGERVRLALVKLVLSNANILVLDEVTNYLDIPSIEAIEGLLSGYPGTLLFTSHDIKFVNAVATNAVQLKEGKFVTCFDF